MTKRTLHCGSVQLDLSTPKIMGILNVTPDSFSDGGRFDQVDAACRHAEQMYHQGATIIDIGGESTRPNAAVVSEQQELDRVIPVVEALVAAWSGSQMILSIDTSSPVVIREAHARGAHMWNDVRALKRPNALQTAAALAIPVVLMHMRGVPSNMNELAQYRQLMPELIQELQQRIDAALSAGILPQNIIVDPGFGFAKNTAQNLELLQQFQSLQQLGFPLLAGLSRKRFIGEVLQQADAAQRDIGSAAAHLLCVQQGARIIRTHNVAATAQMLAIWQATQTTCETSDHDK